LGVERQQGQDTLRALRPQELAQGGLVGAPGQPEQLQQHPIPAQALGVGQRRAAAGQGEEQLRHRGGRGEAGGFAGARVQGLDPVELAPQIEPAAEGVDQDLAAVAGGLVGVGESAVEPGFLFADRAHAVISPCR